MCHQVGGSRRHGGLCGSLIPRQPCGQPWRLRMMSLRRPLAFSPRQCPRGNVMGGSGGWLGGALGGVPSSPLSTLQDRAKARSRPCL